MTQPLRLDLAGAGRSSSTVSRFTPKAVDNATAATLWTERPWTSRSALTAFVTHP
jgi:hypothetical protein